MTLSPLCFEDIGLRHVPLKDLEVNDCDRLIAELRDSFLVEQEKRAYGRFNFISRFRNRHRRKLVSQSELELRIAEVRDCLLERRRGEEVAVGCLINSWRSFAKLLVTPVPLDNSMQIAPQVNDRYEVDPQAEMTRLLRSSRGFRHAMFQEKGLRGHYTDYKSLQIGHIIELIEALPSQQLILIAQTVPEHLASLLEPERIPSTPQKLEILNGKDRLAPAKVWDALLAGQGRAPVFNPIKHYSNRKQPSVGQYLIDSFQEMQWALGTSSNLSHIRVIISETGESLDFDLTPPYKIGKIQTRMDLWRSFRSFTQSLLEGDGTAKASNAIVKSLSEGPLLEYFSMDPRERGLSKLLSDVIIAYRDQIEILLNKGRVPRNTAQKIRWILLDRPLWDIERLQNLVNRLDGNLLGLQLAAASEFNRATDADCALMLYGAAPQLHFAYMLHLLPRYLSGDIARWARIEIEEFYRLKYESDHLVNKMYGNWQCNFRLARIPIHLENVKRRTKVGLKNYLEAGGGILETCFLSALEQGRVREFFRNGFKIESGGCYDVRIARMQTFAQYRLNLDWKVPNPDLSSDSVPSQPLNQVLGEYLRIYTYIEAKEFAEKLGYEVDELSANWRLKLRSEIISRDDFDAEVMTIQKFFAYVKSSELTHVLYTKNVQGKPSVQTSIGETSDQDLMKVLKAFVAGYILNEEENA